MKVVVLPCPMTDRAHRCRLAVVRLRLAALLALEAVACAGSGAREGSASPSVEPPSSGGPASRTPAPIDSSPDRERFACVQLVDRVTYEVHESRFIEILSVEGDGSRQVETYPESRREADYDVRLVGVPGLWDRALISLRATRPPLGHWVPNDVWMEPLDAGWVSVDGPAATLNRKEGAWYLWPVGKDTAAQPAEPGGLRSKRAEFAEHLGRTIEMLKPLQALNGRLVDDADVARLPPTLGLRVHGRPQWIEAKRIGYLEYAAAGTRHELAEAIVRGGPRDAPTGKIVDLTWEAEVRLDPRCMVRRLRVSHDALVGPQQARTERIHAAFEWLVGEPVLPKN